MADFPKLTITNAGLSLFNELQTGETITFTKMQMGNGENISAISSLTSLVSPKLTLGISEIKITSSTSVQVSSYFDNEDLDEGFYWKELGVFAENSDGDEVLYAYSNAGAACDYIPVFADQRIEKYINVSFYVLNADDVEIEIDESDIFVTKAEIGIENGVASLGSDGKIPSTQLPDMDYVETDDIVNNLTTDDSTKVLSAAQGVAIKALVDNTYTKSDTYSQTEIDNKVSAVVTALDWKETVSNYAALTTTYANAEEGWTASVEDTDITYRYNGSEWVAISANSIPLATTSVDGKMSAADKTKINGIEENANNYTHPSTHAAEIITQDSTHRFVTDDEKAGWNNINGVVVHTGTGEPSSDLGNDGDFYLKMVQGGIVDE